MSAPLLRGIGNDLKDVVVRWSLRHFVLGVDHAECFSAVLILQQNIKDEGHSSLLSQKCTFLGCHQKSDISQFLSSSQPLGNKPLEENIHVDQKGERGAVTRSVSRKERVEKEATDRVEDFVVLVQTIVGSSNTEC